MVTSTVVQSMGWTRRSVADSVLRAMENHRRDQGRRVARAREHRGWSQEDLAREAGVSVKTISRLENGRHEGRGSTLRSVAEALGVHETQIIGIPPLPLGLGEPSITEPNDLAPLERYLAEQNEQIAQLTAQVERLTEKIDRLARPARGRGDAGR